jgi:hypothetical protein
MLFDDSILFELTGEWISTLFVLENNT